MLVIITRTPITAVSCHHGDSNKKKLKLNLMSVASQQIFPSGWFTWRWWCFLLNDHESKIRLQQLSMKIGGENLKMFISPVLNRCCFKRTFIQKTRKLKNKKRCGMFMHVFYKKMFKNQIHCSDFWFIVLLDAHKWHLV